MASRRAWKGWALKRAGAICRGCCCSGTLSVHPSREEADDHREEKGGQEIVRVEIREASVARPAARKARRK